VKELFAQGDRDLSHGCIRLQDAERLARWMFGSDPRAVSNEPEQNVTLPTPVPIYVTYLTAQAHDGQLSYVEDTYDRDSNSQVAALR
jgi:murein L,D-transpeptidase YcbB/YkuD